MKLNLILFSLILFFLSLVSLGYTQEERITITTYYPAPYGVYREFTTTGNTYLATTEGNVGIGTTAPAAKLDVDGTAQLREVEGGIGLFVSSAGNVGIGTTAPAHRLEVAGGDALIHGVQVGRGGGAVEGNIAVGREALENNTIGDFNSALGYAAPLQQ